MESIIEKAIGWFKDISEATKELTSGNVSHKACAIRGLANGSAEYLEEYKGGLPAVKWQIGVPKESGMYLVTIRGEYSIFTQCARFGCLTGWSYFNEGEILAWCKFSDIKPYKEETK